MPRVRILTALLLVLILAVPGLAAEDRAQPRTSLERVAVDPALIDVGDGDTVVIRWGDGDDERVRILGIDTPEVAHHSMGWYDDQPYGRRATAFAEGVFAAARNVELLRAAETDGYGRTLGYLFVNGLNYSVLVVKAGYAVETVSHYGDNGLPEESEAVLAASREAAPVPFEAPYKFRRRMRELNDWREEQEAATAAAEAGQGGG
jgi:endonuclease YncB( thermonuclease family)